MLDQRPQHGGGRAAAERADKGPVIRTGPALPAAIAGGDLGGVVEQVRGFGEHWQILRHCEQYSASNPDDATKQVWIASSLPGLTRAIALSQQ